MTYYEIVSVHLISANKIVKLNRHNSISAAKNTLNYHFAQQYPIIFYAFIAKRRYKKNTSFYYCL